MKIKKQILRLSILSVLFISFSCSNNSPADAATAFLDHLYDGDFEGAKEYGTKDTKSMLSMMESFGAKDQMEGMLPDATFKVVETTMDGEDKATVKFEVTGKEEGQQDSQTLTMVKKDGKWLVNMGKEDTNKEGLKPSSNE